MERSKGLYLKLEIIWWIFTIILLAGVLYPILSKLNSYPFLLINSIFVIVFVTFTRYTFLMKHTFIAKQQVLKIVLAILCLPIVLYLINGVNYFQTYIDENGLEAVVGELPFKQQDSMISYIRSLLIFFGVGGIIATVAFAVRLIISVWQYRNRGKV